MKKKITLFLLFFIGIVGFSEEAIDIDPPKLKVLMDELGAAKFAAREQATATLKKGKHEQVIPALEEFIKKDINAEALRRAKNIIDHLRPHFFSKDIVLLNLRKIKEMDQVKLLKQTMEDYFSQFSNDERRYLLGIYRSKKHFNLGEWLKHQEKEEGKSLFSEDRVLSHKAYLIFRKNIQQIHTLDEQQELGEEKIIVNLGLKENSNNPSYTLWALTYFFFKYKGVFYKLTVNSEAMEATLTFDPKKNPKNFSALTIPFELGPSYVKVLDKGLASNFNLEKYTMNVTEIELHSRFFAEYFDLKINDNFPEGRRNLDTPCHVLDIILNRYWELKLEENFPSENEYSMSERYLKSESKNIFPTLFRMN